MLLITTDGMDATDDFCTDHPFVVGRRKFLTFFT